MKLNLVPFLVLFAIQSSFSPSPLMDRISYLPQSILHDILSRLPDKDVAVTSVLSKAWHETWSTFPFLVFYESRFETTKIPDGVDIQEKAAVVLQDKYEFCIWVFRTLIYFQQKGLAIKKFKLVFKSLPPSFLLSCVDWMMLACDSGVEELELDNGVDYLQLQHPRSFDSHEDFPCLPLCVLEAKSLIKLELKWYFRFDEAFLNHPIKFSSLQVLSLTHVYLGDEQVIQNLISSCPLIEKLELIFCYGLKSVSIHGLSKLKEVYIIEIEDVDIDAPSLEDLHIQGFQTLTSCKINIDKCRNLRELSLVYVNSIIITDQWFLELFRKFPLLEELMLEGFDMTDLFNISSIHLKHLSLVNCYNFEDFEIDAPNLYKYAYHGDGSILPSILILNSSSQLVLDVVLSVDVLLDLEILRYFLLDIQQPHIPVNLFLGFGEDSTIEFDPIEFEDYLMVPPSIKHLTLCVISDTEEWCLLLVTNLFWSCRPSIISFALGSNQTLVKIFCEKLISRKEDNCCCTCSQMKCWWHFLKDVKVSISLRKHNVDGDLKTLLEAFPTLSSEEEEEISHLELEELNFTLEWQSK